MAKGKGLMGSLINGIGNNLKESDKETIHAQYGKYFIEGEEVAQAFSLIRDVVIFTDIRIIIIDKQGATGKKMFIKSIFLMNIVDVEMETAGTGIDDSEITISYLKNVKRNGHSENISEYKIEFPKKFPVEKLYTWLFNLAYKNRLEINEASE